MPESIDVNVYFNFRSPYCYLASKMMFDVFDDYHANLVWRPLGGWDGRSPPDIAKKKLPLARQDMARIARRLGIPVTPPPKTTDPTRAGAGSLLAEEEGVLQAYVVEVMRAEWAEGLDIGDKSILLDIGEGVGLNRAQLEEAIDSPKNHEIMTANWKEAEDKGVIGVPSFVVGDEIFWGQDRIDHLEEYLHDLRLRRL